MRDSVVVITGASSGIGRATAVQFARRGARVVLAARRAAVLDEIADQCRGLAGAAIAVPTDVTAPAAVEDLARRAIAEFGRIDVWVNNAAVTLFGRFEETPYLDFRRVIETNLLGYVHGARATLPHFRARGSGVLINNGSIAGRTSQPYTSAYVVSKHAIRALGMSLRQELLLDGATGIHVCTVLPASIDTPLFQHAANFTGRGVQPMPPVYPADQVAAAIVGLAERPKREAFVGSAGLVLNLMQAIAPGLAERQVARMVERQHFDSTRPAPATDGNLFEPMPDWVGVSGGWSTLEESRPARLAIGLAALVPALIAGAWLRFRPRPRRRLPALSIRPADLTRVPRSALGQFNLPGGDSSPRLPLGL